MVRAVERGVVAEIRGEFGERHIGQPGDQERFRIGAEQVWVFDVPGSPAGVGKYFPTGAFNSQLLR